MLEHNCFQRCLGNKASETFAQEVFHALNALLRCILLSDYSWLNKLDVMIRRINISNLGPQVLSQGPQVLVSLRMLQPQAFSLLSYLVPLVLESNNSILMLGIIPFSGILNSKKSSPICMYIGIVHQWHVQWWYIESSLSPCVTVGSLIHVIVLLGCFIDILFSWFMTFHTM